MRRSLVLLGVSVALVAGCGVSPSSSTTSGPATSAVAPPTTVATSPSCDPGAVLDSWSTQRLAEQTVIVPVEETDVSAVADLVAAGAGGVILFGSTAPAGLGNDLRTLVGAAPDGIAPFIMTDEEGGVVQRMANLVGNIPSARQMAATMSPDQIRGLAKQAGAAMAANGITMDLAPVLDLDDRPGPSDSNPDGTRSFSRDHAVTQADGVAFAQGLLDGGVIPVVKHFPGLGDAQANTDVAPAATLPWSTLQGDGLLPFTAAFAAGIPAVMVANASVPGLTDLPASLSPVVLTQVLRQQLHFTGLIMTDSLSGGAISAAGYDIPAAAVAAIAAGSDLIMFTANDVPGTTAATVQAIVAAADAGSTLTRADLEDRVSHVLAAKNIDLCRS